MILNPFYQYPSGELTLAALGGVTAPSSSPSITIEQDHDFIWMSGIYSTDQATVQNGTDLTHGGSLLELLPSSGAIRLGKDATPIAHLFGLIGLGFGPTKLPVPVRLKGGATLNIKLMNLINAIQKLRFTMLGVAIERGAPFSVGGLAV